MAFLDFITNWVNGPDADSGRGLVLFGQAGTGKSTIAHEIARLFDKVHRLTSSFIFSRSGQSEQKAYLLFTTLARHLADRFPQFKIALGRVVEDKADLQDGTRDYHTLFESLILEPLKGLHIVGPILVVIDALDESGDATSKSKFRLHAFLAKNLIKLPSNFRVVITSRPERPIVSAFNEAAEAQSVKIISMDDNELAAHNHDDIIAFFQHKLRSDKLRCYVNALAIKAEGLFQWAAVASQLILDEPARFKFDSEKCIKHLLKPSDKPSGREDLLDELYSKVLEGYFFEFLDARNLFRSVVGQLITSFEPLSIRSLITLRKYASYDEHDDTAVTGTLRCLGSLLSNVNPTSTKRPTSSHDNHIPCSRHEDLPIIPLHTSFRDFLTDEKKSGDFYVDVHENHHQLAHACLGLLLDGLKFNICELETSYLANDDVKDLSTRVNQHIPPALLYASRFWVHHLKHTDFKTDLFQKVETLFKEKFLFWLEILSLTRNIVHAPSAFATLNMWLPSSDSSQGVSIKQVR